MCDLKLGQFKKVHYIVTPQTVLQTSLGPIVPGMALPMPDVNDTFNWVLGVRKRILAATLTPIDRYVKSFTRYSKRFLRKLFSPVHNIMGFEEWLDQTNYTSDQKVQLTKANLDCKGLRLCDIPRLNEHIAFGKREQYLTIKMMRQIYPPSIFDKVIMGPLIASIERVVYACKYSLKYVLPDQKPLIMQTRLGHGFGVITAGDYSVYEASYHRALFELERWFLSYMIPSRALTFDDFYNLCTGVQHIKTYRRNIKYKIKCRRMSGEMTTSLTHFIINMCMMNWIAKVAGIRWDGFFDGDDSVVAFDRLPPFDLIAKVGITYKLQIVQDVSHASFCHIEYCPITLHRMRDPREMLVKIGWTTSSYLLTKNQKVRRGLLKAKAMSFLYEFPHCPILSVLMRRLLYLLRDDTTIDNNDGYHAPPPKDWVLPKTDIRLEDRIFAEDLYGISVGFQLELERIALTIDDINAPLPSLYASLCDSHQYSSVWRRYYEECVI